MEKTSEELVVTIITVTIVIVILSVFTFLFFLLFIKKRNKLRRENLMMKQAFEQELLKTQLETREETLNALSKELHDNVGQLLNSTKLLIGVSQRAITNPPETLDAANETLVTAIQELRTLSKSLDKEWLSQFNFIENLESEISRLNAARSFVVTLDHHQALVLKPDAQIILFRIVQEILQNAIKHAKARNIDISISEGSQQLDIIVKDDGKGFSNDKQKQGSGIMNIQYRTRLLGGKVDWETAPGAGTAVNIRIPVKGKTEQ